MGHRATVAAGINELSTMTIGDMIDRINSSGMINVHAEINENGDGILITDTAGGMTKMKIANDGTSSLASDLNLAGEADAAGAGSIDGSFEYKIDIGGSDTLTTLAEKINALKGPVTATILNDGTGMNSYRLSLISKYSGKTGQFFINSSSAGLQMADLVEGQDAIINLGGSTTNPIVTSSSTNTFTGLIPGLTLNAVSSANKAVDITVTRDTETVNEKVSSFVEKFNSVLTSIKDATKYVAETETAGPLLGNLTADTINTKLYNMITKSISNSGSITRLSELGFSLDSSSKLVFDEDKFNSSYEANPTAVESFFSTMDTGFGYALDTMLDELTRSGDGTITRTTDSYQDRTDMLNERITYLNELLTNKEQRLYRQFQNMETALAKMQTMSSALSSISLLTTSTSNSSSSSSSS
jgi:flagellar hook-associated protein 2